MADAPDLRAIAEEVFLDVFLMYAVEYHGWKDPTVGAVSPALSDFFAGGEAAPALVQWARWLRLDHAASDGMYRLPVSLAAAIVDAMIAHLPNAPEEGPHGPAVPGGAAAGECDQRSRRNDHRPERAGPVD